MKLITTITTMDVMSAELRDAVNEALADVLEAPVPMLSGLEVAQLSVEATQGLKHVSYALNDAQTELTIEISDEVILKYIAVYAKVIRFVGPFIKPVLHFARELKGDFYEIAAALSERK